MGLEIVCVLISGGVSAHILQGDKKEYPWEGKKMLQGSIRDELEAGPRGGEHTQLLIQVFGFPTRNLRMEVTKVIEDVIILESRQEICQ